MILICLYETYITDINDENLKIPWYIMYCVDHPSDVKKVEFVSITKLCCL